MMLTQGYYITAELKVTEIERLDETREALKTLCAETIKEPGCSLFQLHECNHVSGRFLLWERFDDEAAFKQHFEEKHTKGYTALGLTEVVQYFQTDVVIWVSRPCWNELPAQLSRLVGRK